MQPALHGREPRGSQIRLQRAKGAGRQQRSVVRVAIQQEAVVLCRERAGLLTKLSMSYPRAKLGSSAPGPGAAERYVESNIQQEAMVFCRERAGFPTLCGRQTGSTARGAGGQQHLGRCRARMPSSRKPDRIKYRACICQVRGN